MVFLSETFSQKRIANWTWKRNFDDSASMDVAYFCCPETKLPASKPVWVSRHIRPLESPSKTLAAILGMVPSQLVVIVDEMEDRGLIERRENPDDRRRYASHVTEKGGLTLAAIGQIAREHSQALLAALSEEERRQLTSLLLRIADQQGLTRGVHPGFRSE